MMSLYREMIRKSKEGRVVITPVKNWGYDVRKEGSPCRSLNDTPREALDDFYITEKQYLIELEDEFEKAEIPLLKGIRISYGLNKDWFIGTKSDKEHTWGTGDTLDEAIDDLFTNQLDEAFEYWVPDEHNFHYRGFVWDWEFGYDEKTELSILKEFSFAYITTEKMFDSWLYHYMTELDEDDDDD